MTATPPTPNPLEDLECRCGTQRRMTKADVLVCPHCDTAPHAGDKTPERCAKCELRARRTR